MQKKHELVKELIDTLHLTLHPQAVKMTTDEDVLPESAIIASENLGHLAYCQAQALAKRNGKTVYMRREDHWCWASLVGFGMVDCSPDTPAFEEIARNLGIADLDQARAFFAHFPMLPYGKYSGTLVGPAESADFEPDIILISCDNNFQLRTLLWAIKNRTGHTLQVKLDAIDSCIYTIVEAMLTGDYKVAIPDPGDQERALSGAHEIILGVPADRLEELVEGLRAINKMHVGYDDMEYFMKYDYERPPFYNRLFEIWGLGTGRDWDRGETANS